MASKTNSFLRGKASIPGTYQIHIIRAGKGGKQKFYTAYVPTNPRGVKELVRRHFCGVPNRHPEYFMRPAEYRSF